MFDIMSLFAAELEEPKIDISGKGLTLSQTTYFRLFQTEDNHFKLDEIDKVLQICRKHCGKRRNSSSGAISPFPAVFLKDSYCRHVRTRVKVLERVNSIPHNPDF